MKSDLQKRPYKRKYRCNNPDHNGFTDAPAYHSGKIFCQKCTIFRRVYKYLPTKKDIARLRKNKQWKH